MQETLHSDQGQEQLSPMPTRQTITHMALTSQSHQDMTPCQPINHACDIRSEPEQVDDAMPKFDFKAYLMPMAKLASVAMMVRVHHRMINKVHVEKQKRNRRRGVITNCHHTGAKHYAKGMCDQCYHLHGRNKRADRCEHTDKCSYARGMCVNCYQRQQRSERRQFLRRMQKLEKDKND